MTDGTDDWLFNRECERESIDPKAARRVIDALLRQGADDTLVNVSEISARDVAEAESAASEDADDAHEERCGEASSALRARHNKGNGARKAIRAAFEQLTIGQDDARERLLLELDDTLDELAEAVEALARPKPAAAPKPVRAPRKKKVA